jgi:hypothetical protein
MKRLHGTLTTTHIDRHGDRMMLSALESGLAQINQMFVPVGVEHDPRIPPQGRIVRAWSRELDDGEFALDGEFEMFEAGDELPLGPEGRELPIRRFPTDRMAIEYDMQLRSQPDREEIDALAALLSVEAEEEVKKSLDPLAILTLGGAFALGGIAGGFLSRIGEDVYEVLKARLKTFFERRHSMPQETLLRLVFVVQHEGRDVEVELVASRPDAQAIDDLLSRYLPTIDDALPALIASGPDLKRFVFEYADGKTVLKFAVRRDAVPIFPKGLNDI